MQAAAVGFGVEWCPEEGSPPSLLQTSTAEVAFVVDLLALGGSDALAEVLDGVILQGQLCHLGQAPPKRHRLRHHQTGKR